MEHQTLLGLPNDVLQLIANSLNHDNLFTPRYKDDDFDYFGGLSGYTRKCTEYYGERTDDLDQRARGLLSWSVSSKYFRAFLAPYLFETIVLRDRPKSIESVKTLMRTPYWYDVKNLIFATTSNSSKEKLDEYDSEDEEGKEGRDRWITADDNDQDLLGVDAREHDEDADGAQEERDLDDTENKDAGREYLPGTEDIEAEDAENPSTASDLREILSHLPPNLRCLTIDLPEENEGFGQSLREDLSYADSYGEAPFRHTLRTVFASIGSNNISVKDNFELRLYNVPPYKSAAYKSEAWRVFMSNITSFTMSPKTYDNGAGWRMNTHGPAIGIAPLLGELFWNHFDRIQSFALHCDGSWPLGGPDDLSQPLDLPLPSFRSWKFLKYVSFKETFVCPQLLKFLQAHLKTIETVELTDCFAPDYCEYDDPDGFDIRSHDGIRWDSLFKGLAEVKPSSLRNLKISYVSRSQGDLIDGYSRENEGPEWEQQKDQVRKILEEQQLELADAVSDSKLRVRMFQKQILAHVAVDDKFGMTFVGEEENVYKFLDGRYHEQWLELVAVMLKNAELT